MPVRSFISAAADTSGVDSRQLHVDHVLTIDSGAGALVRSVARTWSSACVPHPRRPARDEWHRLSCASWRAARRLGHPIVAVAHAVFIANDREAGRGESLGEALACPTHGLVLAGRLAFGLTHGGDKRPVWLQDVVDLASCRVGLVPIDMDRHPRVEHGVPGPPSSSVTTFDKSACLPRSAIESIRPARGADPAPARPVARQRPKRVSVDRRIGLR